MKPSSQRVEIHEDGRILRAGPWVRPQDYQASEVERRELPSLDSTDL